MASGATSEERWLADMRAWIASGGTYRVPPSVAAAIALCVLALFFPGLVVLLGLSLGQPSLAVEAGVVGLIPAGAMILLIAYRRKACLYLSSEEIGLLGFRRSPIARCPRTAYGGILIQKGSYQRWMGTVLQPYGTWDDNRMYVLNHSGGVVFKVNLVVLRLEQVQLLARLAQ